MDPVALKQMYAGLATLILESAKRNMDSDACSSVLGDAGVSAERQEAFRGLYDKCRPGVRALLFSSAFNLPHAVDADWRLDYVVRDSHVEKIDQPLYFIRLKTETGGADELADVAFSCTPEQLEDLVTALREATKQMERFASAGAGAPGST